MDDSPKVLDAVLAVGFTCILLSAFGLAADARRKYSTQSFISSALSTQRAPMWSDSPGRGRLQRMSFHPEWQHPDCTVMRWYNDQNDSSRKFRLVEHRRDIQGPFYHEFLLLILTDGAICRVERVGEGSRRDAVLDTGCTANDLIQWFSSDAYPVFETKHPSSLISKVDLLSEYDILDVLAVCYAVQNTKACKVYTLQQYNCYFLCLTVLAVLTRRAANWEGVITRFLQRIDPNREMPERAKCLALDRKVPSSLCLVDNLIDPWPAKNFTIFFISIRFWYYGLVLCAQFFPILEKVARLSYYVVLNGYFDGQYGWVGLYTVLEALLKMCLGWWWASTQSQSIALCFVIWLKTRHRDDCARALACKGVFVALKRISKLYDVWSMDECMQDHITSRSTASTGLTSLLSGKGPEISRGVIQIFHLETQGVKDIGVTVRGHTEFDKCAEWLVGLQSSYVQAVTASKLRHKLLMYTLLVMEVIKVIYKITMINWTRVRDWGNRIDKTIVFQEQYINPRIQAHADRVAAHGLAEPLSVWVGIREAMTVVWRSLPPGFGSIEKDDAHASDSGNQQSRTDER